MYLSINGGRRLAGRIDIRAAKNSVLPIIACCILTKETVVLKNCPPLLDIYAMLSILKSIGARAELSGDVITINCADVSPLHISKELTSSIRSSVFILGPLLSRFKTACISYPGGCEIGKRPIDIHLDGLTALGAQIDTDKGVISCDGSKMAGNKVRLRMPSVGATENLMMAGALIKGVTVISNAAREPEIQDLAQFINALGGRVSGAGTSVIIVEGVSALGGTDYTPIPDRIAAGTYMAACAIAGGKIRLDNICHSHIFAIIDKLTAAGVRFGYKKNCLIVSSSGKINAVPKISTMPYPGFPTDMQPQMAAVLSVAKGKSIIAENLFDSRFRYATQLKKMGANIEVIGERAVISGVTYLGGEAVEAQDLRGGAALVLAGLRALGASKVGGVEHIDRGYYKIEDDLRHLNADICRKN